MNTKANAETAATKTAMSAIMMPSEWRCIHDCFFFLALFLGLGAGIVLELMTLILFALVDFVCALSQMVEGVD